MLDEALDCLKAVLIAQKWKMLYGLWGSGLLLVALEVLDKSDPLLPPPVDDSFDTFDLVTCLLVTLHLLLEQFFVVEAHLLVLLGQLPVVAGLFLSLTFLDLVLSNFGDEMLLFGVFRFSWSFLMSTGLISFSSNLNTGSFFWSLENWLPIRKFTRGT